MRKEVQQMNYADGAAALSPATNTLSPNNVQCKSAEGLLDPMAVGSAQQASVQAKGNIQRTPAESETESEQAPATNNEEEQVEPSRYEEALKKVGEAFLKTETGKRLLEEVERFALSRDGGIIGAIVGVPLLASMVANEWNIPEKLFDLIPAIQLGAKASLKITPLWKGPLTKRPTEWGGSVTLDLSKLVFGEGNKDAPAPGRVTRDRSRFLFRGRVLDEQARPFDGACTVHLVDRRNTSVAMTQVYGGSYEIRFYANPAMENERQYKVVAVPTGLTPYDKASTDVNLADQATDNVVGAVFVMKKLFTDGQTRTIHTDYSPALPQ
jgi:hypothetical protein